MRNGALSQEALAPEPRQPVARLAQLAGVGPATASAVYPFFDELVAAQAPGLGPVAFTLAYYGRYATRLRERAALLAESCPTGRWTPQAVSQALWAAAGGKAGLGA